MGHAFQKLDVIITLETGEACWVWMESETDDWSGYVLMMKPRMLLTLPSELGVSELIFLNDWGSRSA